MAKNWKHVRLGAKDSSHPSLVVYCSSQTWQVGIVKQKQKSKEIFKVANNNTN